MAHRSDPAQGNARGVTDEQLSQAAQVLALVAKRYEAEDPSRPVDEFEFLMRVGTDAYTVTGRSSAGGHRAVAALVRERAPQLAGATRGWLATSLLAAARRMGWEDEDAPPVEEAVRRKLVEIGRLLVHEAPEAPVDRLHLERLAREQTRGASAELVAGVVTELPDVQAGETGGAYGARLLEAVSR
jgi:hypothetical protein